ncbi:AtpZ/AtpI family protein, partial [Candidatus Roizmanbacteria bacterium]|nr:AtpZ/AtpI family protein [Candidatus Roizmanbacteria bacterium]
MKFSYLIRRRRKKLISEDKEPKGDDQTGSSGLGLTDVGVDVKMKKDKDVYTLDEEGNIKKIPKSEIRNKISQEKNFLDLRNFNIGFYLLTPIILGVFLGLGLDSWLKTKSVFFITFLLLGTLASFY